MHGVSERWRSQEAEEGVVARAGVLFGFVVDGERLESMVQFAD